MVVADELNGFARATEDAVIGVIKRHSVAVGNLLQPIELIVLETDAPYLAPTPYRGKRNESAYLAHVAERVAEIIGVPVAELAEKTTANALELYKETT